MARANTNRHHTTSGGGSRFVSNTTYGTRDEVAAAITEAKTAFGYTDFALASQAGVSVRMVKSLLRPSRVIRGGTWGPAAKLCFTPPQQRGIDRLIRFFEKRLGGGKPRAKIVHRDESPLSPCHRRHSVRATDGYYRCPCGQRFDPLLEIAR